MDSTVDPMFLRMAIESSQARQCGTLASPIHSTKLIDLISKIPQALGEQARGTGEGWKLNPVPAHIWGVRNPHDEYGLRGAVRNYVSQSVTF
jgi:hypothetical protein